MNRTVHDLIEQLEAEGLEVQIAHLRYTPEQWEEAYFQHETGNYNYIPAGITTAGKLRRDELAIHPKGGKTIAIITDVAGETWTAEAVCSPLDTFCRYIGAMAALGRANALRTGLRAERDAKRQTAKT